MLPGTHSRQLTKRASVHFDMARGLAALAVLFGHMRALFFVPYHNLPFHSATLAAFYGVTALGHQAVIVFFVLSGFFIVSSVTNAFARGNWSWLAYLVNRIVRLSLVLIPALILCCIVDHVGMSLLSTAALYHRSVESLIATSVADAETFRNFIGSFFYVQSILVQPFGSDSPLWSLSYEFWYYILFPVALCALANKFRLKSRVIYSVLTVMIVLFVGRTIALYFLIWLFGGAIAVSSVREWLPARLAGTNAVAILPLVCALGLSVKWPFGIAFLTDSIVAIGFGLWMYLVLGMPEKPVSVPYEKTARLIAGFSYTLYLTHFPLMFFMRAQLVREIAPRPDFIHTVLAVGVALMCIVIAYGIAQITEARTAQVRRRIMGLIQ